MEKLISKLESDTEQHRTQSAKYESQINALTQQLQDKIKEIEQLETDKSTLLTSSQGEEQQSVVLTQLQQDKEALSNKIKKV